MPLPDNLDFPDDFADVFTPPGATNALGPMFRGDTFSFARQVIVDPLTGNLTSIDLATQQLQPGQVAQDLMGWLVTCTLKRTYSDPDQQAVVQLDNMSMGGVSVTTVALGKIRVDIPPLSTRRFPDWITTLLIDLQGKDPAGHVRTFFAGSIDVNPDVTNLV